MTPADAVVAAAILAGALWLLWRSLRRGGAGGCHGCAGGGCRREAAPVVRLGGGRADQRAPRPGGASSS